jgi:hypothetical protein
VPALICFSYAKDLVVAVVIEGAPFALLTFVFALLGGGNGQGRCTKARVIVDSFECRSFLP